MISRRFPTASRTRATVSTSSRQSGWWKRSLSARTPASASVRQRCTRSSAGTVSPVEAYATRILATPGALLVKEADLAHNADPARLAVLDAPTRERLSVKYLYVRSLLGLTAP